jgi:hypothetical protein
MYRFDLVAVQEVTWDKEGVEEADENTSSYGKERKNH